MFIANESKYGIPWVTLHEATFGLNHGKHQ